MNLDQFLLTWFLLVLVQGGLFLLALFLYAVIMVALGKDT